MLRIIIPTILLIASGLTGFLYIKPVYAEMSKIKAEKGEINDALQNIKEIREIISKLQDDIDSISDKEVDKLAVILPDAGTFDKIRFLNNLTAIAARHKLSLEGLSISGEKNNGAVMGIGAIVGGVEEVGVMQVGFSVLASYDEFKSFLKTVEENLELLDIDSLSLTPSSSGPGMMVASAEDSYTFGVNLTTYAKTKSL